MIKSENETSSAKPLVGQLCGTLKYLLLSIKDCAALKGHHLYS